MIRLVILLLLAAPAAMAEALFAARTIPAQSVIGPDDILRRDVDIPGAVTDPATLIGMEARIALFAGRPIRKGDVGQPAIVERNGILPLIYDRGGLYITTEGRALGRAGAGEFIRVMNLSSRNTVTARIGEDGIAYVTQ